MTLQDQHNDTSGPNINREFLDHSSIHQVFNKTFSTMALIGCTSSVVFKAKHWLLQYDDSGLSPTLYSLNKGQPGFPRSAPDLWSWYWKSWAFGVGLEVRGKAIPIQAWTGPEVFQEVETIRFQDNRHTKVVRLSALRTGHLYLLGNIPGGGAVGWGTALQVGRRRVWFPMMSLEFFIDINLPAALWSWDWLSL